VTGITASLLRGVVNVVLSESPAGPLDIFPELLQSIKTGF